MLFRSAKHVEALTLERRLQADLDKAIADAKALEERGPALASEIEHAARRLHDLRVEAEAAMWRGADVGNFTQRLREHRAAAPIIYGDLDNVAEQIVTNDNTGRSIR